MGQCYGNNKHYAMIQSKFFFFFNVLCNNFRYSTVNIERIFTSLPFFTSRTPAIAVRVQFLNNTAKTLFVKLNEYNVFSLFFLLFPIYRLIG